MTIPTIAGGFKKYDCEEVENLYILMVHVLTVKNGSRKVRKPNPCIVAKLKVYLFPPQTTTFFHEVPHLTPCFLRLLNCSKFRVLEGVSFCFITLWMIQCTTVAVALAFPFIHRWSFLACLMEIFFRFSLTRFLLIVN